MCLCQANYGSVARAMLGLMRQSLGTGLSTRTEVWLDWSGDNVNMSNVIDKSRSGRMSTCRGHKADITMLYCIAKMSEGEASWVRGQLHAWLSWFCSSTSVVWNYLLA